MSDHEALILESLVNLSSGALDRVIQRARAIQSLGGVVPAATHNAAHMPWLLEGITEELKRRRLNVGMPVHRITELKQYKNEFEKVHRHIGSWLLIAFDPKKTGLGRTELFAVSCVAAESLARFVGKFAPVGLHNLLHHYGRVPEAIENDFPGYAQAGWLPMLLQRRTK
jgi:hypothetical protein